MQPPVCFPSGLLGALVPWWFNPSFQVHKTWSTTKAPRHHVKTRTVVGRPSINTIEQLRRVFVLTTPSVCPLLFPLAMIVVVAFAASNPDCARASSPTAGPKPEDTAQSVSGRVI